MILVQYLLLSPIQNSGRLDSLGISGWMNLTWNTPPAYIAGLAVIAGATTFAQIRAAIKMNLLRIMKVHLLDSCASDRWWLMSDSLLPPHQISWAIGPLSMVIAQKFLSPELCAPCIYHAQQLLRSRN